MTSLLRKVIEIQKLKAENERLSQELDEQRKLTTTLFAEISRRDLKIIEQQKRLRFFGIEIGNEDYEAEKLDFPSTIKI